MCFRHAQILGTLQAYSHWLCQLNLDSLRNSQAQPEVQQTLHSLITTLVEAVTPLMVGGMPEKVVLPACQYLLSLVSTVKPRFLASLPSMQSLMEKAAQGKLAELPNKVWSLWVGLVGGVLQAPAVSKATYMEGGNPNFQDLCMKVSSEFRYPALHTRAVILFL